MLCYVVGMLILSTALAGVIHDNSYGDPDPKSVRKYVIPYDQLTLPDVQTYVKILEKEVSEQPQENADEDYLNDLGDDLGYEVEEGIEESIGIAEGPSYELVPPNYEPYTTFTEAPYPHTGYQLDAGYNEFVDGLLLNMVDDIVKRNLDPIFFRMKNNTHITGDKRKNKKDKRISRTSTTTTTTVAPNESLQNTTDETKQNTKLKSLERNSLGGGFLSGLMDIARIGDASVRGGEKAGIKQIESNLTIGPVMLELNVRRTRAAIQRQKDKGREVKTTRQIKVTTGKLNGSIIAELNSDQTKLLHFSVSPPHEQKTWVTTKRDKSVNNRLDRIGRDIVNTVFHEGSFIMRRIRRVAERATKKQTVEL